MRLAHAHADPGQQPPSRRRWSDKAYIYVSSYPLGNGITPADPPNPPGGADFKPCTVPHKKISIIEVSAPNGEFSFRLREQPLAEDTMPTRPRPEQAAVRRVP